MSIFVIIPQPGENGEKLPLAITAAFPDAHYPLPGDTWLVAAKGSAQDVSEQLKVTAGENGAAIIIEMSSYFGRANPNIWSWIKKQWEATSGG